MLRAHQLDRLVDDRLEETGQLQLNQLESI
jgi:hypothetical protein